MESTKAALASSAQRMAQERAERWFNKTIGPYLPARMLARLQRNAQRSFWGMVSGCIFSIFFFGMVGVVLVGVGLTVLWAFLSS
jgi:hypothetical protein